MATTQHTTRGIISAAGYVPYRRLQRAEIAKFFGSGGGRGSRSVASYDEDTTTMGVEAARSALASTEVRPTALWFATADPAYLEKTNATTVHAALRLDVDVPAIDTGGAVRSGIGALGAALRSRDAVLVVTSDIRVGLPTGADESASGDAAAAVLVGKESDGPVIAAYLGGASRTDEFIDRWRTPGDARPRQWEERFGETKYVPLGTDAFNAALESRRPHRRAGRRHDRHRTQRARGALARRPSRCEAHRRRSCEHRRPDRHRASVAACSRTCSSRRSPGRSLQWCPSATASTSCCFARPMRSRSTAAACPVAAQVASAGDVPYGKYLAWRNMVHVEPPRRPEPDRISASFAGRTEEWKYAFVGSRDRSTGALHLPPARVSREGDAQDEMDPAPMAETKGTIATFTIDRIAYSPSPPIAFAIVDFDGGGRLPVELTDVDADTLEMGQAVEMTFRRLFTSDGIHNYFWKARPVRG